MVVTTTSNSCGTGLIASWWARDRAASCIANSSPPNAATTCWSRFRTTSKAKSTRPAAATTARMSSCTGLPSQIPQVARADPIRLASCSVSTVSRPASPGAAIFGPPLNPAKKWGSTNPVVIRTSAASHCRLSQTGTSLPCRPHQTRDASSRASWLTTCNRSVSWSPSMALISASVLPRWVPVATSTTTSSTRVMPSSSSSTDATIKSRGWARVPSQMAIATVWPGRTSSRSGGPATGARRTDRSSAGTSGAAAT